MIRNEHLARIAARTEPYDIAIVGGGATGLGAALDAAARGHSVLLLEQHDFAKGTSSRSTKLVHGGVRYLKQGDIKLVREALKERGLLLRNAPHLTHAMPFVIPCYAWGETSYYALGLKVYDALARSLSLGPTQVLSPAAVQERLPTISLKNLRGGVLYYDGQFDDARLAIALARTAAQKGATLVNYLRCDRLIKKESQVAGVEATDLETGQSLRIPARSVINATGVFVDQLRQADAPGSPSLVRASQGVHIVLDAEFLPGQAALMIPKTADGRVLFAVPWLGKVVVGTTDTPVSNITLEPQALQEEIQFILTHAAIYLTRAPTHADVRSVFVGLRPLVNRGAAKGTAKLSRDHTIEIAQSGLVTITGGKWTTYRHMAEDVIDRVERSATLPPRRCVTETLRLADDFDSQVNSLIATDSGLAEKFHDRLPYRFADVVWAVRETMARTIEDVLARRTRSLLLDAQASIEAAPTVARLMGNELNWSDEKRQSQIDLYEQMASTYLLR